MVASDLCFLHDALVSVCFLSTDVFSHNSKAKTSSIVLYMVYFHILSLDLMCCQILIISVASP
jgi:hypothetical protein